MAGCLGRASLALPPCSAPRRSPSSSRPALLGRAGVPRGSRRMFARTSSRRARRGRERTRRCAVRVTSSSSNGTRWRSSRRSIVRSLRALRARRISKNSSTSSCSARTDATAAALASVPVQHGDGGASRAETVYSSGYLNRLTCGLGMRMARSCSARVAAYQRTFSVRSPYLDSRRRFTVLPRMMQSMTVRAK